MRLIVDHEDAPTSVMGLLVGHSCSSIAGPAAAGPRKGPGGRGRRAGNLPGTWGKVKELQGFSGLTPPSRLRHLSLSLRPRPPCEQGLTLVTTLRLVRSVNLPALGPAPLAALVALSVGLAACGDDPFFFPWESAPDTVLLYSLARPEPNLDAAFNFHNRVKVRVEAATATGNWDVAVDTRGGQLVFLPPGALGIVSKAGVAALPGFSFDDLQDAPKDTAVYSKLAPVPVELGTVYVVKTSQSPGIFGTNCSYYAKIEPLVIDVEGGTLRLMFDASPVCNSLRLIPPD